MYLFNDIYLSVYGMCFEHAFILFGAYWFRVDSSYYSNIFVINIKTRTNFITNFYDNDVNDVNDVDDDDNDDAYLAYV